MSSAECLEFWFSAESEPYWFQKSPEFDRRVAESLGDLAAAAALGALDRWQETAEGSLALVLLLDQVPRNLYRNSTKAYAQDEKARAVTRHALALGQDLRVPPERRSFLYMPLEHSESLADQYLSVALFGALPNRELVKWAEAHLVLIERYGRFPHRNAVLGRRSTPAEDAYLAEDGAGF